VGTVKPPNSSAFSFKAAYTGSGTVTVNLLTGVVGWSESIEEHYGTGSMLIKVKKSEKQRNSFVVAVQNPGKTLALSGLLLLLLGFSGAQLLNIGRLTPY